MDTMCGWARELSRAQLVRPPSFSRRALRETRGAAGLTIAPGAAAWCSRSARPAGAKPRQRTAGCGQVCAKPVLVLSTRYWGWGLTSQAAQFSKNYRAIYCGECCNTMKSLNKNHTTKYGF